MEHVSSKNIILWMIAIIVIVISIIGLSFAIFDYSRTSTTETKIEAGTIMLGYLEETNGVSLTNAMPIRDANALATTDSNAYFDFYVTYNLASGAVLNYEIDIENTTAKLDQIIDGSLTSLPSNRIKVALIRRTTTGQLADTLVSPTYFSALEATRASNSKAGYLLYKKSVTGENIDYYRLYMWIPELDQQGNAIPMIDMDGVAGIREKAFSVRINVQALAKVND